MQDTKSPDNEYIDLGDHATLERLLQNPKKESDDWQATASRLTAIEHNRTLSSETDEIGYLKSLTLCKWAQTAGVKDAKKRNIQATRYRSQIPPALEILKNSQQINAALELMSNLRGAWCSDYINSHVQQSYIDKKGLTLLINWAQKTSQTPIDFLNILLTNNIENNEVNEKRTLLLIKETSSKLTYLNNLSTEVASNQTLEVIQFTLKKITETQSEKLSSALSGLIEKAIEKVRLSNPSVLIHGHFLQSLSLVQENQKLKKIAQKIVAEQIGPTLKVLEDLCTFGGQDGISYGKIIIPALKKTYLNLDKNLAEFAKTRPILLKLNSNENTDDGVNLEDIATSIYARLLPRWSDFYASHSDRNLLSLINEDLHEAARINGIEYLGNSGDIVSYDPVSQRLENDVQRTTTDVCIVRPAVIFRRANGTYRIILPALVK